MVDETAFQRRASTTLALPAHRRTSTAATIGTIACSPTTTNPAKSPLLSSRSLHQSVDGDNFSWSAKFGGPNTGSETLAAKLPRSQTAFVTSTSPTSPVASDRFRHPARSNTTGHPSLSLTRTRSNLQSVKTTATTTPSSYSGASHSSGESVSTIDPLSQHILHRTVTSKSISRLNPTPSPSQHLETGSVRLSRPKVPKEKRKAKSFLSRILHHKKKDHSLQADASSDDDASDSGLPDRALGQPNDARATGTDAEIFAQPIGGYAYVPRYPDPPKYIKVRSHNRKQKDFDRVFVAQELLQPQYRRESVASINTTSNSTPTANDLKGRSPSVSEGQAGPAPSHGQAVWTLEFSRSGRYLAAAGQDHHVRVWSVISSPADRQAHEIEEEARDDQMPVRLTAPVFKAQPIQVYEGHTGSVVDLSWSKNDFLLSTSMDKTVRLWHVTRAECLCVFKHSDFVTSIKFHPKDDRFFLAGSLDMKLRLWSIPDKSVAYEAAAPDMITAVAFTPDGKHAIAGLLNGLCIIYDTDGLKVLSQIHVGGHEHKTSLHSGHGSHRKRWQSNKGSKITGIDSIVLPPENVCSATGQLKLLITSNDSRIRLYNFKDRTLEAKLRGNENSASQIRASFSPDGRYIICGSESRKAYIWPLHAMGSLYDSKSTPGHNGGPHTTGLKEKDLEFKSFEVFEAQSAAVTNAVMAPVRTKQILGGSGDLLYDLCNPPPVTLGNGPSGGKRGSPTSESFHRPRTSGTSKGMPIPCVPKSPTPPSSSEHTLKSPHLDDDVAGYMAPASHPDGNILVTADTNGSIKVFRQDCGYWKRPALPAAAAAIVGTATPASGNAVAGVSGAFDMTRAASNANRNHLCRLSLLRHSSRSTRRSLGSASNVDGALLSRPGSRDSRHGALSQSLSTPNLHDDGNGDGTARGPVERLKREEATGKRNTLTSASPSERILHWRDTIPVDATSNADSVEQFREDEAGASLSVAGWAASGRDRSPSPVPSGESSTWARQVPATGRRLAPRERDKVYKHHPFFDSRETSKTQLGADGLSPEFRVSLISPSDSALADSSRRQSFESASRDRDDCKGESDFDVRSQHSSTGFDKDVFLSLPGSPLQGGLKPVTSRSGFVTNTGTHPLSPPSTTGDRDTVCDTTSVNPELLRAEDALEAQKTSEASSQTEKSPASQSRLGAGLAAGALYWTRLAAQALTSRRSKSSLNLPKLTVSGINGTNTPISTGDISSTPSIQEVDVLAQAPTGSDLPRGSTSQSQSTLDRTRSNTATSSRMTTDLASPISPVKNRVPQFPETDAGTHAVPETSCRDRKFSFDYNDDFNGPEVYDEDEDEDELRCAGCGHNDFRALKKPRRLICRNCGTPVS